MKKGILLLGGLFSFGTTALAQLPVSTVAENKNVVLEEFTGIHCQYCPDGHLKAKTYASTNPGDVVLINIHAGGYATPGAGEPDFRTEEGDEIDGASGLIGYPAGQINRRVFTPYRQDNTNPNCMAMSRTSWSVAGDAVLSEPSYVNIALEGKFDVNSDSLEVNVEMYFTAAGPAAVNLNVALLQSDVPGPQTGASTWNPTQILPSGQYNHEHIFRGYLTGQWGEEITTTASGTLVSRTYKIKLPLDINGVPLSPDKIELAAFVAEGHNDIITGANGPVTLDIPTGAVVADLEVTSSMSYPSDLCDQNITPEISVTNNYTDTVRNFDVVYILDEDVTTTVTQNVAALAGGEVATVTFPAISIPVGEHSIKYYISTSSNNMLCDIQTLNNLVISDSWNVISPNPFATGHLEDFESKDFGDLPDHSLLLNPAGASVFIVNNSQLGTVNYKIGGYGNSQNSFLWYFYGMGPGTEASLIFEKLDLSNATGNKITFSRAYCQYQNENDKLEVGISTDCGVSWTNVYSKAGTALATRASNSNAFWPQSSEWATDSIDISAYDNTADVMIRFRGISGYGNSLFIDDIKIENSTYVGVEESPLTTDLVIYPNPASDVVNVSLGNAAAKVTISILDATGKRVMEVNSNNFSISHVEAIDVSSLNAGVYMVQLNTDGNLTQQKLIIK